MSKNIIEIPPELESKTLEWLNALNYLQSEIEYHNVFDYLAKILPELGFITTKNYIYDNKWHIEDKNFDITVKINREDIILKWITFKSTPKKRIGFVNTLREPFFKFYYILKQLNTLLIQMQEQKTNE